MRIVLVTAAVALVLAGKPPTHSGAAAHQQKSSSPAVPDYVLHHGKVFTGDPKLPWAEAIAVRGNRIIQVGKNAAILALASSAPQQMDLQGRTVIPGINDAGEHLVTAFERPRPLPSLQPPNPTLEEVTEVLRRDANSRAAGTWLFARVGERVMREATGVRAALDAVSGDHPVLLLASWRHGVILNTSGLQRLHIGNDAKDPPGGHYERDPDGQLTGKLEEYAGWRVLRQLDAEVPADTQNALFLFSGDKAQLGITSAQMMTEAIEPRHLANTFPTTKQWNRIRAIRMPMPDTLNGRLDDGEPKERHPAPWARISGVQWVIDGTPADQLAYRNEPYEGRPGWRGRLNFPRATIHRILQAALKSDEQLVLDVEDDASTDLVFSEMEGLAPPERWRPRRVRLEHGDGVVGRQVQRARRLGIVIAQPRANAPLRTWLRAGIPVAYGSDGVQNPFSFVLQASTSPGAPAEAVSREDAVRMLTRGGAYAERTEHEKGMLAPGMLADMAVLSQDVFTVRAGSLPETRVWNTFVDGKVVFGRGLRPMPPKGVKP